MPGSFNWLGESSPDSRASCFSCGAVGSELPDAPLLAPEPGEVGASTGEDWFVVDFSEPEFPGDTGPLDNDDWHHAGDESVMHTATAKGRNLFMRDRSFEVCAEKTASKIAGSQTHPISSGVLPHVGKVRGAPCSWAPPRTIERPMCAASAWPTSEKPRRSKDAGSHPGENIRTGTCSRV